MEGLASDTEAKERDPMGNIKKAAKMVKRNE